jgi:shikimate kinase
MDRVAAEVTSTVALLRVECPNVNEAVLVALTSARVMLNMAGAPDDAFAELLELSQAAAGTLKRFVISPDGSPEVKA